MADWRQMAVATAVAILFATFVVLLMDLVYPEPDYSDYCVNDFEPRAKPIVVEAGKCVIEYGEEYDKCVTDGGVTRFKYNESGCAVFDRCDFCNKDYNAAQSVHTRNFFLVVGVIGLAAIFAGTMWKIEFLATGLMFGGIILMLYATVRYFGDADKLLRVIIILGELLIVLWIGYKKLYNKKEKRERN